MSFHPPNNSWYNMLKEASEETGDSFIHIVENCTLSIEELNVMFDDGYGGSCGKPFSAWGEKYVYFPIVYDGAEWVGWAPRNPCDESMPHQGGE